jgi:hypothetical protein
MHAAKDSQAIPNARQVTKRLYGQMRRSIRTRLCNASQSGVTTRKPRAQARRGAEKTRGNVGDASRFKAPVSVSTCLRDAGHYAARFAMAHVRSCARFAIVHVQMSLLHRTRVGHLSSARQSRRLDHLYKYSSLDALKWVA